MFYEGIPCRFQEHGWNAHSEQCQVAWQHTLWRSTAPFCCNIVSESIILKDKHMSCCFLLFASMPFILIGQLTSCGTIRFVDEVMTLRTLHWARSLELRPVLSWYFMTWTTQERPFLVLATSPLSSICRGTQHPLFGSAITPVWSSWCLNAGADVVV